MKVLFLNVTPSPYRVDFFNELSQYCDLTVWYYYNQFENRSWKIDDNTHLYSYEILFPSGKYTLKGLYKIAKSLCSSNFNIIILGYALPFEIYSILILKLLRKKFVINSDGGFINTHWYKNIIKRLLIRSASWWLSSGKNTTNTLLFYGAEKERIFEYHFTSLWEKEILKEPLNTDQKFKIRKLLNIPPYKKVILGVGQYIPRKGFEYLIDAISQCPKNIMLYLIGEGSSRSAYEKLISEQHLEDQVILTGYLPKETILKYYKAADLFVLPSLEDIWGLVVNEAVSNALPIIATERSGAAFDLVEEGKNGFIVPIKDVKKLKSAIEETIYKVTLNEFAQHSLELAKSYSIEKMAEDHICLFNIISPS